MKPLFGMIVVSVVILSYTAFDQGFARTGKPAYRHITIRQMSCETNVLGVPNFQVTAVNTTGLPLENLSVTLNVANGDAQAKVTHILDLVEEEELIKIKKSVPFDNDVKACFVNFKVDDTDIHARFRP